MSGQEWWDDFWKDQGSGELESDGKDLTWHNLIWRVNLEFWYDLFEKRSPGKQMLECGCGKARVSQHLAHAGYVCTLLDYSEEALQQGRKAFETQSLDGRFIIGDINSLCIPDNSFDIVFSGGVLEFFEDAQTPIKEMVRVLRPGGIFAANMVPRKFSIQTIADLERTLAYSGRNLIKGRFGDVFKRVQSVPSHYGVNSLRLQDYTDICLRAGLDNVTGLGTSPFPDLALPGLGQRVYARAMKKMLPFWNWFNHSSTRWTEFWGITYTIYGIKG